MEITNGNDIFYVIAVGERTFLHYFENADNTALGDVFTAERFDTAEEAQKFIDNTFGEDCGYVVREVVVNWTIR